MIRSIEKKFIELFSEKPVIIRSPGRVNIIGEHTDYNMGYVLPAAINKVIYFAVSPRQDNKCFYYSYDLKDSFEFTLPDVKHSRKGWPNYLTGVVDQLIKEGYPLQGFNCIFGGNIPIGAGLSSSAAIEAGLIYGLNNIFNLGIDKLILVKLAQKSENEFVGVKCGIMDQFINIFGEDNKVLKLDCRSLDYEYYPLVLKDISIVLFDTGVSHSLATSEYNQRRKECSIGVDIIKKDHAFVNSLRDVRIEILNEYKNKMDEKIFRRCKYVIEENERLIQACIALEDGDIRTMGKMMYGSHDGLKNEYEVSCDELDFLVDNVRTNPDVIGSRMMGGGFGGCTINLIKTASIDHIVKNISKLYSEKFSREMKYYITSPGKGTSILKENEYETV